MGWAGVPREKKEREKSISHASTLTVSEGRREKEK